MKVVCFSRYYTGGEEWNSCYYHSYKFVHALKGNPIKGYARVPVRGVSRRLQESNKGSAAEWFGQMAADYLEEAGSATGPLQMIPIPNSDCTVQEDTPRTIHLAQSVSANLTDAIVSDVLRFTEPMVSAHEGGPRSAEDIYEFLRLTDDGLPESPVILVDDVYTMGGHLRAAECVLREAGREVSLALCGGTSVHEPFDQPFGVFPYDLEEFNRGMF